MPSTELKKKTPQPNPFIHRPLLGENGEVGANAHQGDATTLAAAGTEGAGQQHNMPTGHTGAALPQPPTPFSCSPAPAALSHSCDGAVWQTHRHRNFAARKRCLLPPAATSFLNNDENHVHFAKVKAHS